MEINRFTAEIAARLRAAGVDEATANTHARAFVNSIPENELTAIAAHADDDAMMRKITDRIKAHIQKTNEARPRQPQRPAPARIPAPNVGGNAVGEDNAADEDDEDDMIDAMLSAPISIPKRSDQEQQRPVRQVQPAVRPQPQSQPNAQPQRRPQSQQVQKAPTQYRRPPVRKTPSGQSRSSQQQRQRQDAARTARPEARRRPIYKPDPNADYSKFYIILACTSPLWGLAALFVAALFIIAIGGLSIAIVLLIAGLFGGVAVGVVLALVGIIYGITQLFEQPPVGMYEIGLGIMIGGFVMFLGILAYNGAVRLLPFLIKEVLVLLSFTIHKCIELYYFVKGRCADL